MTTYISNGTMGEMWMAQNCYRCTREDADNEQYCPVLSALMMHEYPIEGLVLHADRMWPDELECTYFDERAEADR